MSINPTEFKVTGSNFIISKSKIIANKRIYKLSDQVKDIIIDSDVENIKVKGAFQIRINGNVDNIINDGSDITVTGDITGGIIEKSGNINCYGEILNV